MATQRTKKISRTGPKTGGVRKPRKSNIQAAIDRYIDAFIAGETLRKRSGPKTGEVRKPRAAAKYVAAMDASTPVSISNVVSQLTRPKSITYPGIPPLIVGQETPAQLRARDTYLKYKDMLKRN